jgi:G protein beta subunit-like protein
MSVVLATGSYDHKIRFFEAPSGVNSKTLRAGAPVNCLEITPNKQFIAAGCNPQIRLFEINDSSNANPDPVLTLEGHTAAVTSLGFQKDVRYLYSGSEDGTVKIFDLRSPQASCSFDCKAPVNSVVHHPSRPEIISGDQNGVIRVWDLGTSKCINELAPDAHYSPPSDINIDINSTASSPSTTTQSASASASKPFGQRASIQSVDISEDGKTLIAANNHAYVFIWDPSDSANFVPITKFHAHPTGTYLLKAKISPDCRQLVTCSSDQSARIYDISRPSNRDRNQHQHQHQHHAGHSNFTPKLMQSLTQHNKWVWDCVFSADSSYLVTASSDHSARLFNLRSGEVVRQYTGHQSAVTCVALNDSSS